MPKWERSCIFLTRCKEGEDPNGPRHIRVSYKALEGLFHLSLKDAARQIGLCATTFKKACRRFDLEQWPFRKEHRDVAIERRNAQTGGVDAANRTLHRYPLVAPATPARQTEVYQAVTVSCTSPVVSTSALCVSFSPNASSSSIGRCRDAVFSSAAPEGLASTALDTRSCGEPTYAGPAFQHTTFAPLGRTEAPKHQDAPSYIDSLRGCVCIGVPTPRQPTTGACGGEQGSAQLTAAALLSSTSLSSSGYDTTPLEAGPPGGRSCVEAGLPRERSCVEQSCVERSCVEAVMDYLDGPLAETFDFMFADEA